MRPIWRLAHAPLVALAGLLGVTVGAYASPAPSAGPADAAPAVALPAPKDALLGVDLLGLDVEWRLTRGPLDLRVASYGLTSIARVLGDELWEFEVDENRTIASGAEAGVVLRPFTRADSIPVAAIGVGIAGRYRRVARHATLGYPDGYLYDEVSLSPVLDWSVVVAGRWRLALSSGLPLLPVGVAKIVYRDGLELEHFSRWTEPGVRFWRVEAPTSVTIGIATAETPGDRSDPRTEAPDNPRAADPGQRAASTASRDRPPWQQSVAGDRWQLGFSAIDGHAPVPVVQRFVDRRRAVAVSVNPWSAASLRRLQSLEPEDIIAFSYEDLVAVGLRAYPLLHESALVLSGISLGVELAGGHGWRQHPGEFRWMWGASVSPVVGFSAKYFEWLWLDLSFGSQLRLAVVTDGRGEDAPLAGQPTVDIVPRVTIRAGVSFGEWE